MPAFNAARTIERAIESAFGAFDSGPIEVVVVDDGSSDETLACCLMLREKHSNLVVVPHALNRGGGAARNTATMAAKYDLIFCLDSDNVLLEGSGSNLVDSLQDTRADAVAFANVSFFKDGSADTVTHRWSFNTGPFCLADALETTRLPIASGNYLFTRDAWHRAGGYPEFAGSLDAWGFGFRQLAQGQRMLCLKESEYLHRYGHESYWVRDQSKREGELAALQLLLPVLSKLVPEDQEYVLSAENRATWLDQLELRPLRLQAEWAAGYNARLTSPAHRKTAGIATGTLRRIAASWGRAFRSRYSA